ncbi:MAG TPA: DUF2092 domain-containing protein [Thermodesulfobacteriota bacterium]|nr:DUF2092 domain-containing protein [Thermodesulfobacteriota bacterium]
MKRTIFRFVSGIGFVLLLAVTTSGAQASAPTNPNIDEKAMSILNRAADFVSKSSKMTVTADIAYEALQNTGEKIEFGSTNKYTIQRPSQVRVEIERRDGSRYGYLFDGKKIWAYSLDDNVYATVPQPGNIDKSYEYMNNALQTPIPLSQLFSSDLPNALREQVKSARYVEESTIAGVRCDQLAIRTDEVDAQLWIAKGDKPLPKRIIITYKNVAGQPQFRAQFGEWNLSPKISSSLFVYNPPKGAENIPFAPQVREEIKGQ